VSASSIWLYFALDKNPLVTLIPLLFFYIFTPVMDAIMGEDPHNPPEEVVNEMMADNYYRFTVHTLVFVAIALFLAFVVFVGTQDLPWWAIAALIIGVGSNSGGVMTMTHELGHKSNKLDRLTAKIAILLFLIPHHFLAWLTLTQANYVEHYGLLRQKLPNGKYERCQKKLSSSVSSL